MWRRGPHHCSFAVRGGPRRGIRIVAIVLAGVVAGPIASSSSSYAAAAPGSTILGQTRSYYERDASPNVLYLQGEAAGKAGSQGIVILDFGRPALDGAIFGTMGYGGAFLSLKSIATGVETYISAYYRYAPAFTFLNVAVGTNNSCGTGQPCGETASCGCPDEPPNFTTWGEQLALVVEDIGVWAGAHRAQYAYTDDVRVLGADDVEPAFDPGYYNTYDLLLGYANAVDGYYPALVDYGSAESSDWTENQLLQVAYGFRPDVAMPEIYYPEDAAEWAALLSYAKAQLGREIQIYGVLTEGPGTNTPGTAYFDMLQAVAKVTHQSTIPWSSTIAH
jgi:hypothetical protein